MRMWFTCLTQTRLTSQERPPSSWPCTVPTACRRRPPHSGLEGFLQGSGALLAHSDTLWNIVNGWLLALPSDTFTELLPLLRRTVATFSAPERRELGERAAHPGGTTSAMLQTWAAADTVRAQRVLRILHLLLAPQPPPSEETVHDG